jgi:hypothetical protein
MSMHYFLCSGGTGTDSTKSVLGHVMLNFFLHPMGSAGHIVHSGASRAQNINTLFFLLGWDRYGFNEKHAGTYFAELVFLHPVGYAGHVVHSGATGA